jgi:cytochrome c peroxidase
MQSNKYNGKRKIRELIMSKVIFVIVLAVLAACSAHDEKKQAILSEAVKHFAPLPEQMPGAENDTPELIALGEKLYFETMLSDDHSLSCNSCHVVNDGGPGVDNLPTSPGVGGVRGERNSPTVLNAGFHFAQFWDGRAADLKEQAGGPVLNSVEMAMPDEEVVMARLSGDADYPAAFAAAFPGAKNPLTYENMTAAIAAFERTLITHDRFDTFLSGKLDALSNAEAEGLQEFMLNGCITCHSGALLGGHIYQKSGLVHAYKNQKDEGRFLVTGIEADKYYFKVPSMRNVAITAPYFHDGGIAELDVTVREMAYMQLDIRLNDDQVNNIVSFLNALTDPQRKALR